MASYDYFLLKNHNNYKQYGKVRRGSRGVIPQCVIHTFEWPPGRSLLSACTYLLTRTTPGSYHFAAGGTSERDVMPLAPVNYETWHCVPSNNWAIGISATTYASAWGSLSAQQRKNFVHSLAYAAYLASQELIALGKSPIPAKFISRDEAMAGVWGFTYHREMDPGRRTDPANPKDAFPWDEFLTEYKRLMGEKTAPTDKSEEDVMNHFVFEAKDAKGRKHQYIFNPRSWTHQYIGGDVDKNNYRTIVENVGDKFHVHWGELRGKAGSDELGAVHLLGTYVGPADFRPVGV